MKKFAIALALFAAAVYATPAFAIGDRYELWGDTNGDTVVDTILDTDPGSTLVFYLNSSILSPTIELKVLDTWTATWIDMTGSSSTNGGECDGRHTPARCVRF